MKKGFTLIELLAVIIILAVIALIATPVVLNVVEEAKVKADRNSVYGLVDAAKLYYAESLLDTQNRASQAKLYYSMGTVYSDFSKKLNQLRLNLKRNVFIILEEVLK